YVLSSSDPSAGYEFGPTARKCRLSCSPDWVADITTIFARMFGIVRLPEGVGAIHLNWIADDCSSNSTNSLLTSPLSARLKSHGSRGSSFRSHMSVRPA